LSFPLSLLSMTLALRCLIKQFQAVFNASTVPVSSPAAGGYHADGVIGRNPVHLIAGTDPVTVGDRLGHRQLQLAGDF